MKERVYRRLMAADMPELTVLHRRYKQEIGETAPDGQALEKLREAIANERILFYGCEQQGQLEAICSVTCGFSTFCYDTSGSFEDFYVLPEARHQGIARELASFAWRESGVKTMTVGCAPCDRAMYEAIGFRVKLGELLAWEK
ncbi:MAG: GNAT family N-acetyltransferase [Clostridia bacterium]|nr:GNAT family N-acetyltransferase [Clostridia bacterium]